MGVYDFGMGIDATGTWFIINPPFLCSTGDTLTTPQSTMSPYHEITILLKDVFAEELLVWCVLQVRQDIEENEVELEFVLDATFCFQARFQAVRYNWPATLDLVF